MCCPLSPLLERSDEAVGSGMPPGRNCGGKGQCAVHYLLYWSGQTRLWGVGCRQLGPSSPNPYQGRDLWLRPSAGDYSHGSETFSTVDRPFRCYKPQWEWEYGWSAAARLLAGVATGPSHWPGRLTSAVTNSWLAAYITSSEL